MLSHLSLFHLLSSIYNSIIDACASILPIFVVKKLLIFQKDFGFSGVSGQSESDTHVQYTIFTVTLIHFLNFVI